jgi:putative two-component system response regulator
VNPNPVATPVPRPSILVVDDVAENLFLMFGLLKSAYSVRGANSGDQALKLLHGEALPDLMLVDVMMPGMSGYDLCRALKANPATRDIPVIFVTAMSEIEDERRGLEAGAVDYITKPVNPYIALARIKTHLENKAAKDWLKNQNAYLAEQVALRTREVTTIQDVTILAMASLAETRDNDTGNHIRRTQHYVRALATRLRHHPRFAAYLSTAQIDILFKSAPLHDIGKVGIPDRILLKPGKLDPDEFEIMKTHTTLGKQAIEQAEKGIDQSIEFLSCAKEIALSHQEKWDGSGYPEGLAGDCIPVSARLMALADVYDALICRRVYKPSFPHAKAVAIILQGRGSHFDPDMVDAFASIEGEFRSIAERFADSDQDILVKQLQIEASQ